MMRTRSLLLALPALCGALACASADSDDSQPEPTDDRMGAFVGGWDGATTQGSSVLLIREGLTGTLSGATLIGPEFEYQITYGVEGEGAEDSDEEILLGLACAEIRTRPVVASNDRADVDADPELPSHEDAGKDEDTDAPAPGWTSLDCAGWELELRCGLAGDCGVGDCNMLCDVAYFGDAYATAAVALMAVEDEFDHWQRV